MSTLIWAVLSFYLSMVPREFCKLGSVSDIMNKNLIQNIDFDCDFQFVLPN